MQIKNQQGQLLGVLQEGNNDQLGVYGPQGQALGFYVKSSNKTFATGKGYIGNGDQRMLLLDNNCS
jgi:hypothetical protein